MWQETLLPLFHRARKEQIDYADVRVVTRHLEESIRVRNGEVGPIHFTERIGIGIRILRGGVWGFASCSTLDIKAVEKTLERAIQLARASGTPRNSPAQLCSIPVVPNGYFRTPVVRDPFRDVSLEEKLELLTRVDQLLRESCSKAAIRETGMYFSKVNKIWMNSEGSFVEQELIESGAGMEIVAISGNEVQRRSFPNSFRGNIATAGYEYVESMHLQDHAARIGQEAEALLHAEPCPDTRTDLILMPDQLCLQIHESVGHAVELDRIFGTELTYAGGSFLSGEFQNLGNFRYASPLVTIVADATVPEGLGSFGFDDEGVEARKIDLIRNGILTGFLSSRETSEEFRRITGKALPPTGCMRASHSNRIPLIRMTNLNLEPGEGTLDELIGKTDQGILMETNMSWSIDDLRKNFSFGTEIAWEIRNGKRGRLLKNPYYTGMTTEFWNSCDAVCGPSEWKRYGTPNCGKGMPGQSIHVGHAASPARFARVKVGSRQ